MFPHVLFVSVGLANAACGISFIGVLNVKVLFEDV